LTRAVNEPTMTAAATASAASVARMDILLVARGFYREFVVTAQIMDIDTILTGAGVSAASGVPTFRGAGGLWRQYRAEELATPGAFARDPSLVWEWYAWRRELIASCRPNAAHEVIARWSRNFERCCVLTQNVDD